MNRRKTIGVFIGQIGDRYHSQMWPSIVEIAEKHNFRTLLFIGQSLNDPGGFLSQENIIYRFADKENIDGLITITGSLCNYISDEQMSDFFSSYKGIPLVSVARKIPGVPNIMVDNYKGMYDLVSHMIEEHGRKKIVFIRGPENNPDAELRYDAYKNSLKEHDIPLDMNLVAQGTFAGMTGAAAVTELLDVRKVKFDCLIAANDDMLLWANRVLVERKFRIPEDISVGGFDNLVETQYSDPPITTVEQPLSLMAAKAADILIDMMDGKDVKLNEYNLPAKLVIRKSCGCFARARLENQVAVQEKIEPRTDKQIVAYMVEKRDDILKKLVQNIQYPDYQKDVLENYIYDLIEAFLKDIEKIEVSTRLETVTKEIIKAIKIKETIEIWSGILYKIQNIVQEYIGKESVLNMNVNYIFQTAQNAISEQIKQIFNFESGRFWSVLWNLQGITQSLSGTFEIEKIKDILLKQLPGTGIFACNIALYENPGMKMASFKEMPSKRSKLLFAYDQNRVIPEEYFNDYFETSSISPFELFADGKFSAWGILPLHFENMHFGYISFELHTNSIYIIHDSLKEHVSSSLKGSFLIQELKNTQNQLIEAAKTAKEANYHKSKVLVNMSHELRTPLNSINGIAGLLQVGGYEMTREVILVLKELVKELDRLDTDVEEMQELKNEVILYLGLLDNGNNTKPFFFRYFKDKITNKFGAKFDPILKILDRVIDYQDKENEVTFKAYKHIKEAGVYLLGLIDMVLNLSKVETGKMEVFRTNVTIRSLVESTMVDSGNYARSINKDSFIKIEYNVARDVPENCFMDKQKVKEVLLNFLSNGIKYTAKGIVKMSVVMEDGQVRFSVTDNGIGINEDERNKIFTEFGRTEEAKNIEGTGLGLMLSKKLVEMQDGKIGFDSQHGKGSTFWFTIPMIDKI
jgi:DNA-binding LacI/PurR family transcriptional regulator/signal transduction histidine kinase